MSDQDSPGSDELRDAIERVNTAIARFGDRLAIYDDPEPSEYLTSLRTARDDLVQAQRRVERAVAHLDAYVPNALTLREMPAR